MATENGPQAAPEEPPAAGQPAESPAAEPATAGAAQAPLGPPVAAATDPGPSPLEVDRRGAEATDSFARRPEVYVGGAFLGAFVLAKLLGRLGGDD